MVRGLILDNALLFVVTFVRNVRLAELLTRFFNVGPMPSKKASISDLMSVDILPSPGKGIP